MAFTRVLVLTILVADALFYEHKFLTSVKYEMMCRNLTSDPYFETEKVTGTTWSIYFAWNMILGHNCIDVIFMKVTFGMQQHYKKIMHKHVSKQPNWSNATLLMIINLTREVLLIPDDQMPVVGRFVGVPNIHRGGYIANRAKDEVKMMRTAMKLFEGGRYLLLSDCQHGVTSFLVRKDQKHTRGEIVAFVESLYFGEDVEGYPACKFNRRKKMVKRNP